MYLPPEHAFVSRSAKLVRPSLADIEDDPGPRTRQCEL